MGLFLLLLSGFDGMVVGMLVFYLIAFIFGDKPIVRLIKLLLGVSAGIGYFLLCLSMAGSDSDNVSMGAFLFTILAPAGLMLILWLINYMFKNDK